MFLQMKSMTLKHKAEMKQRQATIMVVSHHVIASIVLILLTISCQKNTTKSNQMIFKIPFVFSNKINPKETYTVGDQLVSEHIFGFWASSSTSKGLNSIFGDIKVLTQEKKVVIQILSFPKDESGQLITINEIKENIEDSLKGTQHSFYQNFLEEISIRENTIEIEFYKIPYNIKELLASADYAITKKLTKTHSNFTDFMQTGPYSIGQLSKMRVELKINPNYPSKLRANTASNIIFEGYPAQSTHELISSDLQQNKIDGAYLYGHTVTKPELEKIRNLNYKVNISPTEWMIYIGFSTNTNINQRIEISNIIDKSRERIKMVSDLGTQAYSIQPTDRAFGINEAEYTQQKPKLEKKAIFQKKLTFATLDEWKDIPLFSTIISILSESNLVEVKLYTRENMRLMYSSEVDLFLSPLGISPFDPLINLMVFHNYHPSFKNIITKDTIKSIVASSDSETLIKLTKDIELSILRERLIIPLMHFPGITVEKNSLEQDSKLEWGWGIHAWTYRNQ